METDYGAELLTEYQRTLCDDPSMGDSPFPLVETPANEWFHLILIYVRYSVIGFTIVKSLVRFAYLPEKPHHFNKIYNINKTNSMCILLCCTIL